MVPLNRSLAQGYLKVRSYYTAIALRCRYIDYISAARHRSITAFQVKLNLTFMRHRSAISSNVCVVRQRNAIAV